MDEGRVFPKAIIGPLKDMIIGDISDAVRDICLKYGVNHYMRPDTSVVPSFTNMSLTLDVFTHDSPPKKAPAMPAPKGGDQAVAPSTPAGLDDVTLDALERHGLKVDSNPRENRQDYRILSFDPASQHFIVENKSTGWKGQISPDTAKGIFDK